MASANFFTSGLLLLLCATLLAAISVLPASAALLRNCLSYAPGAAAAMLLMAMPLNSATAAPMATLFREGVRELVVEMRMGCLSSMVFSAS